MASYPWSQTALRKLFHMEREVDSGSQFSLNFQAGAMQDDDTTYLYEGASYVSLSSTDSFKGLVATGQSENPLSLHFSDQF